MDENIKKLNQSFRYVGKNFSFRIKVENKNDLCFHYPCQFKLLTLARKYYD